jgi:hypothetical protein
MSFCSEIKYSIGFHLTGKLIGVAGAITEQETQLL